MIKVNGKEYRNIQEQVAKNQADIEELKESGITPYTAGSGIDITEDVISVDNTVAMKTDIPTNTSDLTNDSGFITIADVPVPTAGTGIDITNGQISVDNTVAMKTDIPDTYTKTQIDNKDTATLNAAKAYTDAKAIAGASIYEYELIVDSEDLSQEYHMRFISSDGGLINTSVPESFSELVDFVKTYGISDGISPMTRYWMSGYLVVEDGIKICNITVTSYNGNDSMSYSTNSTVASITSSDIVDYSIRLYKRIV